MSDRIVHDIVALHQSFQEWYTGTAARSVLDTVIAPKLSEDFTIVFPSSLRVSKQGLLDMMSADYGNEASFRIEIRDVHVRLLEGSTYLATYEEWQTWEGHELGLKSSAVIQERGALTQWITIHETRIRES